MKPTALEFFYDFSSPYAYLAHAQASVVAGRHGVTLVPRPFLLGGLFRALDGPMVPILEASPQKQRILRTDIGRWAEVRALPYAWPSRFPMNTILALRVVLQLDGQAHLDAMAAIFRAYWGHDRDISDAGVIAACLTDAGLDAAGLLAGCASPAVKAKLMANGEEAFKRGFVGAPTFACGDRLVWGQDRFELIERLLDGWEPQAG